MADPRPPTEEQQLWIKGMARHIHRIYLSLDREDIEQQLYLFWYENWDKLQPMIDNTDEEKGKAYVLTCLRRWGNTYAKNELAAIRGWHPDDMQQYSSKDVAAMLPFLNDLTAWSALSVKGGGERASNTKLKNRTGDALAIHADLTAAFDRLSPADQGILLAHYVDGETIVAIGDRMEVSEGAARKRVAHALGRLCRDMDGIVRSQLPPVNSTGRGRRLVTSNQHWRTVTAHQGDERYIWRPAGSDNLS